jgi:hypothetical protein
MSHFEFVQTDASFHNYTVTSSYGAPLVVALNDDTAVIEQTRAKILAAKAGYDANAPKNSKKFLEWLNR